MVRIAQVAQLRKGTMTGLGLAIQRQRAHGNWNQSNTS
jgi:hypothetical protein